MRLTTVLTNAGLLVASLSWTTNALFRSDLGTEGSIIFWVANVVTRQILTFLSLLIHSGVSKRRRGGFSDLLLASGLSSRGSSPKNVIFSNGLNFMSECLKLLY